MRNNRKLNMTGESLIENIFQTRWILRHMRYDLPAGTRVSQTSVSRVAVLFLVNLSLMQMWGASGFSNVFHSGWSAFISTSVPSHIQASPILKTGMCQPRSANTEPIKIKQLPILIKRSYKSVDKTFKLRSLRHSLPQLIFKCP